MNCLTATLGVGLSIYTPTDLRRRDLITDDRPYAGWLYGTYGLTSYRLGDRRTIKDAQTFDINVGVVGPAAQGEWFQNTAHRTFNIRRPDGSIKLAEGWANQLKNEPGFFISYQRLTKRTERIGIKGGRWLDASTQWGGALGTIFTYADAGASIRIGRHISDGLTPVTRPVTVPYLFGTASKDLVYTAAGESSGAPAGSGQSSRFEAYVFGATAGRLLLRNEFLDGNLFRTSPQTVQKRPGVVDVEVGASVRLGPIRTTYRSVVRTSEFTLHHGNHYFGSFDVTYERVLGSDEERKARPADAPRFCEPATPESSPEPGHVPRLQLPRFLIVVDDQFGWIDASGVIVIPPRFDDVRDFEEGLARVRIGGCWGAIDVNGNLVIPAIYGRLYSFSDGFAAAEPAGSQSYGYIDVAGVMRISPRFNPVNSASRFSEGLAGFIDESTDLLGYVDKAGAVAVPAQFDPPVIGIPDFSDGLASVRNVTDRKFGYIDKTGQVVVPFKYEYGDQFRDGFACVVDESGSRYIDKQGSTVHKPWERFGCLEFFDGLAAVEQRGLIGFVDMTGSFAIPPQFKKQPQDSLPTFSDGLCAIKQGKRWGYINRVGQWTIPPGYDSANAFVNGLAYVSVKSRRMYVAHDGRIVWQNQTR